MKAYYRWLVRLSATLLFVVALVACGGGSGGGGGGNGGGGSTPDPVASVTVSGHVTYDFVPVSFGLNYAGTEPRPVRFATVQYMAEGSAIASTRTDEDGEYSLSVPANRVGFVRVLAESRQTGTPGWHVRVLDNINEDAIYSLDGSSVSSGSADSVRDLHAPSGWSDATLDYAGERAAAPFAILDTIEIGAQYMLAARPVSLPLLNVHWSTENIAEPDEDGDTNPDTGEIGSSFFAAGFAAGDLIQNGMYVVGTEDNDTDEYDRHVLLHEYGHYLMHHYSRSDSFGGPHGGGDYLDMRVAFSEGWPTAFAAMALGDPVYTDTGGPQQSFSGSIDIENGFNNVRGWYSEHSVFHLVYDLMDSPVGDDDPLAYSFGSIMDVMSDEIDSTRSLVSIFPFMHAIRQRNIADGTIIDALLASEFISPINDEFGDDETNDAGSDHVLPIYSDIEVNGAPVRLCSTDEFNDIGFTDGVNKLGARRFLRFTPSFNGDVLVSMTATDIPAGQHADPDYILHNEGFVLVSEDAPTAECQAMPGPGTCIEPNPDPDLLTERPFPIAPVQANQAYIIEIYEWTNIADQDEFSPIGLTCFDVEVTQQ